MLDSDRPMTIPVTFFSLLLFVMTLGVFVKYSPIGEYLERYVGSPEEGAKASPILRSSEAVRSSRVGVIYIHQSPDSFEAIPIQKYTFLSGSVIKAISMDGKEIISSSYTLFLEDKD